MRGEAPQTPGGLSVSGAALDEKQVEVSRLAGRDRSPAAGNTAVSVYGTAIAGDTALVQMNFLFFFLSLITFFATEAV